MKVQLSGDQPDIRGPAGNEDGVEPGRIEHFLVELGEPASIFVGSTGTATVLLQILGLHALQLCAHVGSPSL